MTALSTQQDTVVDPPTGETLSVPERLVVASTTGVFHRLAGDGHMRAGDMVNRGDVIGIVQSLGASNPIHSPFEGLLVAVVALDGERVRPGQPVAWLRV
jgi:biotin carboxyl carrier protein